MDIWQKIFLYLGSLIGAILLMIAIMMLGTSENGVLTVEGLKQMAAPLESFYEVFRWVVYVWLISGLVIFIRFLRRFFR
ncbi:MAG: hypothetical protein R3219_02135 [Hydrogenovibrio sp.]|nr:hypothetical protein [Hydrogenovibrio sp.]